ncbi:MAG: glycoside hydrolase family 88 protein [Tannerella sp.]|jgi:unsaturated rhamnogalacturonyl hydrolase|nr:glycoside hydrolase family 88 protein [Tannerella sp.]
MKHIILKTIILFLPLAGLSVSSLTAQNRVTTTNKNGYITENGVTMMISEETTTRYRRTTSQGDPEARLEYIPGGKPELYSLAIARSVMARYPDYRKAYWKDYTYVQGYMFEAMDRMGELTGDSQYTEYMKAYIDNFTDENGNYKGDALTNLDNFMTGSAFCTLYKRTGDERYKKAALQILAAVDSYPSSDGQFWHGNKKPNMWIDGVFMMQMFLIRCGQYVGETEYCFDLACSNIIAAAKHLQLKNGLLLHAWTTLPEDAEWADKHTGLSPEVWSEGMGWYTLVVPELLAVLPKTHKDYNAVLKIYTDMAKGIRDFQDKQTGGWFFIVDKGSNPLNFIDASGTAMFLYSIRRGINLGILKEKEYAPVAQKGYEALKPFLVINKNGLIDLVGACDGVTIKRNFLEYISVNKILNAKEAVAGALWAAVIMEEAKLTKDLHSGENK